MQRYMSFYLMLTACVVVALVASPAAVLAQRYIESPMLAEKVAAGKLPPIEERLPVEPFVVGPGTLISEEWLDWEAGRHGGTLRLVDLNRITHEMWLALGTTILRAPDQSTHNPAPSLVSDFSVSEDFTTYTLTIREGLRWSDGDLVTTEDVRFLFERIYLDERVTPVFPAVLRSQGHPAKEPGRLEIVDEHTFRIVFDEPYGWFIAELSSWIPSYTFLFQPSHFLKQFHIDYTPLEEIAPLLAEYGLREWWELLALKSIPHWEKNQPHAVGVPVLSPWYTQEIGTDFMRFARNPFFHMVDIEGSQLPYIDYVVSQTVMELPAIHLRVIAGEVDLLTSLAQLVDMPLFRQHEEGGNYRLVMSGSINNPALLFLNQDYDYENENSVWQRLMKDEQKRFSRALALAINSADVNRSLYFGLFGMPETTTPEYNPEEAARLLDEIGMSEVDGAGFRLGPDGERFELSINVAARKPDHIPLAELLKEYFEAVGIRTRIDSMGIDLSTQRIDANEHMASIHWNDGPIWRSGISIDYHPGTKGGWAEASWQYYITAGRIGRRPPAYIQEFFDIHSARREFPPESPEGLELFEQLRTWFGHNLVFILPTEHQVKPAVFSRRLGNVVKDGFPYDRAGDREMKQLFFRE